MSNRDGVSAGRPPSHSLTLPLPPGRGNQSCHPSGSGGAGARRHPRARGGGAAMGRASPLLLRVLAHSPARARRRRLQGFSSQQRRRHWVIGFSGQRPACRGGPQTERHDKKGRNGARVSGHSSFRRKRCGKSRAGRTLPHTRARHERARPVSVCHEREQASWGAGQAPPDPAPSPAAQIRTPLLPPPALPPLGPGALGPARVERHTP